MPAENISSQAKEYYDKGLFAFEKKNYDYALELFAQALKIQKDFVEARHYLRLSSQKKNQENPPSLLTTISNKFKSLPSFIKAFVFESKTKFIPAIEEYEKILKNEPNNIYILIKTAQCLLKQHDHSSALQAFEEIRQLAPNNIIVLKNMGQLYSQIENYPLSRECYETILKLHPHEPEAEKNLKNLDALGTIKKNFGPAN